MINFEEYFNKIEFSSKLFEKLEEKIFLKTEMDVVYTDITNWERVGLLFASEGEDKGNWKKISYIEYVWIKIVEQLKEFGCENEAIIGIKKFMLFDVKMKDVIKKSNENLDLIKDAGMLDDFLKLKSEITDEYNEMSLTTILGLIVANTIIKGEQMSFFFKKDNPEYFIFFSNELLIGYEKNDSLDLIQDFFNYPFFSIPLSAIISRFINNEDKSLSFENQLAMIITDQEHKLLKVIRKKFNDIKSLKIKFKEGNIELIEITSIKKVALENKLIDYIKKGDYQKIIIDTVDGKIVNFENTQKIKM